MRQSLMSDKLTHLMGVMLDSHGGAHPARFAANSDHFANKDSRQINILETTIAKVFNFGGICP